MDTVLLDQHCRCPVNHWMLFIMKDCWRIRTTHLGRRWHVIQLNINHFILWATGTPVETAALNYGRYRGCEPRTGWTVGTGAIGTIPFTHRGGSL